MGKDDRNEVIDPKLLELLVCPLTKGPLVFDREHSELISKRALLAYPVRGGIPIMLPSEARPIEDIGSKPLKGRQKSR
jgi:uncharacterized protein YbaR (Trm112 family)